MTTSDYEWLLPPSLILLLAFWLTGESILFYLGCGLLAFMIFLPTLARWLAKGWRWIVLTIGKLNSYLLLSLIFFFLLTPIALLYRLLNRDPLWCRPGRSSYFRVREEVFEKKIFERFY